MPSLCVTSISIMVTYQIGRSVQQSISTNLTKNDYPFIMTCHFFMTKEVYDKYVLLKKAVQKVQHLTGL